MEDLDDLVIKAKYAGNCSLCRKSIKVGATIEWESGDPPRHVRCAHPKLWTELERKLEDKLSRDREEPVYTEAYVRKVFGKS